MDVNDTVEIGLSWPKTVATLCISLFGFWVCYESLDHPRDFLRTLSWFVLCVGGPLFLIALVRMLLLSKEPMLTISPQGIYDRRQRKRIAWTEIKLIQRDQRFRYRYVLIDIILHPTGKSYLVPFSCHTISISTLQISGGKLTELLNEYLATYGQSSKPSPAPQSTL